MSERRERRYGADGPPTCSYRTDGLAAVYERLDYEQPGKGNVCLDCKIRIKKRGPVPLDGINAP